jgi:hypothetical protein
MHNTRKHRKKNGQGLENETDEFQDAIRTFDYETEWDQAYFSKKDRQSSHRRKA